MFQPAEATPQVKEGLQSRVWPTVLSSDYYCCGGTLFEQGPSKRIPYLNRFPVKIGPYLNRVSEWNSFSLGSIQNGPFTGNKEFCRKL